MSTRRRMAVPIALVVLAGTTALLAAVGWAASSPRLCGSCHEMGPRTDTWAKSAHAEVQCVQCHLEPTEWYELPQRALAHGALLRRDVVKHLRGGYADPVDSRVPGVEPMKDEVCLHCHDRDRKATSGFRIKIDHGEHSRRNGTCVTCHVRTAHPKPSRGRALSLMGQCYTCHGRPDKPKASVECDVCHPAGFELLPSSHAAKGWKTAHGGVAKSDPKQCVMCHQRKMCDSCHGLEMPHPDRWAEGREGHASAAKADREVCARCHGATQDWCAMCHHKGYDPKRGTWTRQHFIEVRTRGAAFCLDCHSPVYCAGCHVRMPGDA